MLWINVDTNIHKTNVRWQQLSSITYSLTSSLPLHPIRTTTRRKRRNMTNMTTPRMMPIQSESFLSAARRASTSPEYTMQAAILSSYSYMAAPGKANTASRPPARQLLGVGALQSRIGTSEGCKAPTYHCRAVLPRTTRMVTNQPQPPGLLPGRPHLSLMHSPRVRPELMVSLAVASCRDTVRQGVIRIYIVT